MGSWDDATRKAMTGKDSPVPEIYAAYQAIMAERAAERAKAAAAKAKEAAGGLGDLLGA